jgi:xanthine dehydrogenase accessory factor
MIGSLKRVRQVLQAIEQTGISQHHLPKIHAPIGLDIGALTPEEIAVSIGAELILVRRGGTGHPLSEPPLSERPLSEPKSRI